MRPSTVYCFFEQSGTFKNEFIKLGINAVDYDILNDFNQTDKTIDLFEQIDKGGRGETSIFDSITPQDLIFAFFPCTYFAQANALAFSGQLYQKEKWTTDQIIHEGMKRHEKLNSFYKKLCQLVLICLKKDLPLIIENPATQPHYLTQYFIPPTIIDKDRRENGDYYKKPTQYWFFGIEPQYNILFEPIEKVDPLIINKLDASQYVINRTVTRSLIHPQYANRFIRQYILEGESTTIKTDPEHNEQLSLF